VITSAARTLLALVGGAPFDPPGEWSEIAPLVSAHRLSPLLHLRMERRPADSALVPAAIRSSWAAEFRSAALFALTQRRALIALSALLAKHGIPSTALKGSFLAWHAYPHPAARPMRDIDLLVPSDRALAAYRLLREAGWSGPPAHDDLFAPLLDSEAHLPPLLSPEGVVCELHIRAWAKRRGWPSSLSFSGSIAEPEHPALRFPTPSDNFVHLCVHAAQVHRFDNGPLLLADIAALARYPALDWDAIGSTSEAIGAQASVTLVCALVGRWCGIASSELARLAAGVDGAALDAASRLMAGGPEPAADARVLAALADAFARGPVAGGRALAGRSAIDPRDRAAGRTGPFRKLARLRSIAMAALDPRARADARSYRTLSRHLPG
jgi:hypothetical protein